MSNTDSPILSRETYDRWAENNKKSAARVAYLESQFRRIAHGDWARPTIDSANANTYAQIAAEMQNIATLALTAIVSE